MNSNTISKIYIQVIAFLSMLICFALAPEKTQAQIENLIVEKWYIADNNDATDTTEGRSLQAGIVTYRIYLDLASGSKIKKIFGSDIHPLRISSTSDFYNNIDRPNAYFGYLINKSWYTGNPTLSLDSWLTLGLTSTQYAGTPKTDDTDGSFIGGSNNNGGSSSIPGGLLVNNDPAAGIPVTVADGYVPNTQVLGQWFDQGFKNAMGEDTTVFGSVNTGNEFLSYDAILQQAAGVTGADAGTNKVLVAQLTTSGDLSFELNAVIEQFDGTNYTDVTYVANGDSLLTGEIVSPFLSYPPACGCTDPDYLEYSSAYACSEADSCQTLIRFGCMDPLACNYDASANFNLPSLCCYPGLCDDRNLSVVCPSIAAGRYGIRQLFPNPANEKLTVKAFSNHESENRFTVYNSLGQVVVDGSLGTFLGEDSFVIEVGSLTGGLYRLMINNAIAADHIIFSINE